MHSTFFLKIILSKLNLDKTQTITNLPISLLTQRLAGCFPLELMQIGGMAQYDGNGRAFERKELLTSPRVAFESCCHMCIFTHTSTYMHTLCLHYAHTSHTFMHTNFKPNLWTGVRCACCTRGLRLYGCTGTPLFSWGIHASVGNSFMSGIFGVIVWE